MNTDSNYMIIRCAEYFHHHNITHELDFGLHISLIPSGSHSRNPFSRTQIHNNSSPNIGQGHLEGGLAVCDVAVFERQAWGLSIHTVITV